MKENNIAIRQIFLSKAVGLTKHKQNANTTKAVLINIFVLLLISGIFAKTREIILSVLSKII
jgi:hypothetical protein